MLDTENLLVKCPRCGARPMAVSLPKTTWPSAELEFRCGHHEAGHLQRPRPVPQGATDERHR